jgi:predicted transcriptional regulator
MQRTEALRLKLSPDMMDRLSCRAAAFGMPEATFAAFAVADFLNREEAQANLMRMAAVEMARRATDLDEEKMEAAFKAAMPAIVATLSDEQIAKLRLDHKAVPQGDAS